MLKLSTRDYNKVIQNCRSPHFVPVLSIIVTIIGPKLGKREVFMTSVTMVTNDSAALHTTKKTDARNVKEIQGYPASQNVKEQGDATSAPRQKRQANPRQKRKQERRQQKQSVLLDTRSGHDRRNAAVSQTDDAGDANDKKTTGINVYT
jgi:hypothetical protein